MALGSRLGTEPYAQAFRALGAPLGAFYARISGLVDQIDTYSRVILHRQRMLRRAIHSPMLWKLRQAVAIQVAAQNNKARIIARDSLERWNFSRWSASRRALGS